MLIVGAWFVALWFAESLVPFYGEFEGRSGERLRHDARNLGLALINAALVVLLFGGSYAAAAAWTDNLGIGALRMVSWPSWAEALVAFVAFDSWMYAWHRANHRITFLWRFHRMHHSDKEMNATTGVRFHPGEIILSRITRLVVITLFGMDLWHLAVYESVFFAVVLFHHSNVRLPRALDHGLLALIVTPAMHRVHHSRWRPETDSNFGSVFPYWDLLFNSFRLRADAASIHLGLDELDGDEWQRFSGMLRIPFASVTRSDAR
jgi:sterol desaturase/sphingolipid hydroxylase (fatty acid hydroxylase superfamily)